MRLLAESGSLNEARARLAGSALDGEAARAWLTPEAFATVQGVAAAVDHAGPASPAEIGAAFDRAATISPEGGVALYSLGDPALLGQITAEVVDWMASEGLFTPATRVLEVGCGIGRFLVALAPRVALAVGLDVSTRMAAEAGRRCAALANALPVRSSGLDLSCVADASVELTLFADSFPYLVQAGAGLPERHFGESARVLRPGGRLLILNYSYRGDPARDGREAERLARANELEPVPLTRPKFPSWDADALLFERPHGQTGDPVTG